MAWYKYDQFFKRSVDSAYDEGHEPGHPAPYAGIYRCVACGREIGIAQNHELPPQNHHQHNPKQGRIQWQLIVDANHEPH